MIALVGLLVNVLSARALGPEGRGELALWLQLSYILAAVCAGGNERAYPVTARGTVAPTTGAQHLFRVNAAWTSVVLLASVAIISIAGMTTPPVAALLAVLVLGNLCFIYLRTVAIVSRVSRGYLDAVSLAQGGLLVGASAFVVFGVVASTWWLLLYAVSLCAGVAWFMFYAVRGDASTASRGVSLTRAKGLSLLPSSLASMVMLRSDRILIAALSTNAQLGMYVVVATMIEVLLWPVQAFADSRVPEWRVAAEQGSLRVTRIYSRSVLLTAGAAVIVCTAVSALLVPLFGSAYEPARTYIPVLGAATVLLAISRITFALWLASGGRRTVVLVDVVGAGAAVIAYVLLIPEYGALGAAFGSVVGYGAAACVGTVALLLRQRARKRAISVDRRA